jgi:WD40 repeat protein
LEVIDPVSGAKLRTIDTKHTFPSGSIAIRCIRFSKDGGRVLTASTDNTARLISFATGTLLVSFEGHGDAVNCADFNSIETHVVTGCIDRLVRLFDANSGECIRTYAAHTQDVNTCITSTDDKYILSGSDDSTIIVWWLETAKQHKVMKEHSNWVYSLAWLNATTFLSGSGDNSIRMFEFPSCNLIRTFQSHSSGVRSIAATPDGIHFASGSWDASVKVWRADSTAPLLTVLIIRIRSTSSPSPPMGNTLPVVAMTRKPTSVASHLHSPIAKLNRSTIFSH